MHYDAGCSCTQGILLGDYFESILTGQNLSADLAQQAAGSPFLRQYNSARPGGLNNPSLLPGTELRDAFERPALRLRGLHAVPGPAAHPRRDQASGHG
jgi:hypothetical protein